MEIFEERFKEIKKLIQSLKNKKTLSDDELEKLEKANDELMDQIYEIRKKLKKE